MSPSGSRPSTAGPLTSTTATANIGPSCPPARLAEINNRPNTSLGALQSSYANSTVPKVSSPLARHSVTMSSHAQEAATTPVRSHPAPAYSNLSTLEPPEYFPRPDSSSSNYLDRPFSSSSKDYDTPLTTTESPLALPAVSSTSTILSTPRQSSEGLLPPRRELPFARATPPKSAGSDGMRPVSRASSGPMGPPPIPSPSRIPNHMPSFARISDTGLNSSFTQRKTHSSEHVQDQVLAIPKSASSNNFGANLPSLPQPTFVETIAETAAKTARTNSSPATYGNPALVKRSSAQPLQSSTGGAQNVQRSSTPVDPPAFTDSEASYQCRIISELAKNSNENTSDALSSYAAKSEDERRALLDNFIWENMHDDNFITLVEDMGMCWSRVGLGLG